MNIKLLEKEFIQRLKHLYGTEEAKSIFNLSASTILKVPYNELITKKDSVITDQDSKTILALLDKLKTGIPIQHVLGETIFYGLPIKVNGNVLIPRPETEELVEWIIEKIKTQKKVLLDIGTGSGCIPIALKKNIPDLEISAIDVSSEAIKIAVQNAEINKADINFIEADILNYKSDEEYDVIVSNPPYIRDLEKADMHKNVLDFEPHNALFVSDENPLIFYKAIADFAITHLKPNGFLFFEINEFLWSETIDLLLERRFKNIELKKDMQGKDRMIMARTNP